MTESENCSKHYNIINEMMLNREGCLKEFFQLFKKVKRMIKFKN